LLAVQPGEPPHFPKRGLLLFVLLFGLPLQQPSVGAVGIVPQGSTETT
jgi:hypothetical protein